MAQLPEWIATRLNQNLNNALTQRHVVETMLEADRPYFSIRQIHARIKTDVSKATVRNRLNELHEIDIVATESYPESVTLYYINYPESAWPLSPEGRRALTIGSPLDRLSMRGFITLRDTAGIRTLALAGYQFALLLLGLGAVFATLGVSLGDNVANWVTTLNAFSLWGAAVTLFVVSTGLLVSERVVSWLRSQDRVSDVVTN